MAQRKRESTVGAFLQRAAPCLALLSLAGCFMEGYPGLVQTRADAATDAAPPLDVSSEDGALPGLDAAATDAGEQHDAVTSEDATSVDDAASDGSTTGACRGTPPSCSSACGDEPVCEPECLPGATCSNSCGNSGLCTNVCAANSTCDFDCQSAAGCLTTCERGSTCTINCPNGECSVTCMPGATCEIACIGSPCGFASCEVAQTTVAGRLRCASSQAQR